MRTAPMIAEQNLYPIERVLNDADHLADSAEQLLLALNRLYGAEAKAEANEETAANLESVEQCQSEVADFFTGVRLATHEYRKRVRRYRESVAAAAQKGGSQIAKHCERCHDGEGRSIFPFYGVGPHICGWRMGKPVVGHSEGVPQRDWPANFTPDPELGGQDDGKPPLGTWTHCLHCGAGKKGGA